MNQQELLERLRATQTMDDRYTICAQLDRCFLGRSPQGRASLLVPCRESAGALGRAFGNMLLQFRRRVTFEIQGQSWTSAAAVLECLEETLLPTFVVLARDVSEHIKDETSPAWERVTRALASWERLLRNRPTLSDQEQLGLWGELMFIRRAPSVDGAIRAWSPKPRDTLDFTSGGTGVDVKTSTTRLRHAVSHHQAQSGDGNLRVHFASVWAVPDSTGQALSGLVDSLTEMTSEIVIFEQKLLAAGFSRRDADGYSRRFSLGGPILLFASSQVPKIRDYDPGISSIRYVVELDPTDALDHDTAARQLAFLCGIQAQRSSSAS